jgi:hypothetical protein
MNTEAESTHAQADTSTCMPPHEHKADIPFFHPEYRSRYSTSRIQKHAFLPVPTSVYRSHYSTSITEKQIFYRRYSICPQYEGGNTHPSEYHNTTSKLRSMLDRRWSSSFENKKENRLCILNYTVDD